MRTFSKMVQPEQDRRKRALQLTWITGATPIYVMCTTVPMVQTFELRKLALTECHLCRLPTRMRCSRGGVSHVGGQWPTRSCLNDGPTPASWPAAGTPSQSAPAMMALFRIPNNVGLGELSNCRRPEYTTPKSASSAAGLFCADYFEMPQRQKF